jgi:hypothetical protein
MKKTITPIFIFLMLFFLPELKAQTSLYIRFASETESYFPLTDIRKISFDNDFVKLQLQNGTSYSWAAGTIDYYKYDNITSVKQITGGHNPWELKVIPNPSDGKQTLRFRLAVGGDARLQVFDAAGKQVYEKLYEKLAQGEQELSLDWRHAVPGNYRLLLQASDFAVSQTIIRR